MTRHFHVNQIHSLVQTPLGGQRPARPLAVYRFSSLLTIALSFFARIARLLDRVVIVRVPSHPNDKANRQCYENKYNNYF